MRIRTKLSRVMLTIASAAAVLLGTQTAAHADTRGGDTASGWVQQDTDSGYCRAYVLVDPESPYAYGLFVNHDSGFTCTGWLERSTNNGSTWSLVSGTHAVASTSGDRFGSTGDYWDGIGYLARACFRFDFSGAAAHCSFGIGNFIEVSG